MNKFGDLTSNEFSQLYLGRFQLENRPLVNNRFEMKQLDAVPTTLDWRAEGAVTSVKDQGPCLSSWAFSTTGSTEGCHFISTKNLVSLSEQNLIDCSIIEGNLGCDGGLMTQGMDYIIGNDGVDTEDSYPYVGELNFCNFNPNTVGATLENYENINSGDENELQQAVFVGPTSAAIDSSHQSFQFYASGIYSEPSCSSTQLDHAVLVVGWGVNSTTNEEYWIAKNCWGTSWGEKGYFLRARNAGNMCGIATMATLPQC